MEDLYSIHPGIPRSEELGGSHYPVDSTTTNNLHLSFHGGATPLVVHKSDLHHGGGSSASAAATTNNSVLSDLIKAQIARHPRYSALVSAYIECRKVGAPPEMASLLEEIGRENFPAAATCGEIGADPELDQFMESYCEVLVRYKEELSKPFDEATSFLSSIEMQLTDLCKGTITTAASTSTTTTTAIATTGNSPSDEACVSSEEELSCGEVEAFENQEGDNRLGDQELKKMLLRKYSGYLSSLRKEFMKKRKKGKLPKDARMALLDWWNTHYRWPYPTEEEKAKLAEITGLDQKQINNWFINQRKRHWKPSEDMRFALMEGVSGGASSGTTLYFDTRTIGP